MNLIDTVVLVAAINPTNEQHRVASDYLGLVGDEDEDTFVPTTTLLEFDLVMKGRKYTSSQRSAAFSWLSHQVPETRLISNSPNSIMIALELQEMGLGYFDSMIAALANQTSSAVVTPDKMISQVVSTKW